MGISDNMMSEILGKSTAITEARSSMKSRMITESHKIFDEEFQTDVGLEEMFSSDDANTQYTAALTVNMMETTRQIEENLKANYSEAYTQTIRQSMGSLNTTLVDVVREDTLRTLN